MCGPYECVLCAQDNGYTFIEPLQYLTCWVALNDATPENGCPCTCAPLHVVPHESDTVPS